MSNDFHCECDKGQTGKLCRIFDGNDELYHNALLARQIADVLTEDGLVGVSVRATYRSIMEHIKLIDDVDLKINLMVDSLDSIEHPSLAHVKRSIQIANVTRKRSKLKRDLVELYRDLGKLVGLVGVEKGTGSATVSVVNTKKAYSY